MTQHAFDLLSDLYKDARGFRPSASFMEAFTAQSYAEQKAQWDKLCEELREREYEEAQAELRAQREFEQRIQGMVADYGIDRSTALKWDMESFEINISSCTDYYCEAVQEIEHYLYLNGLSFRLFPMYVAEIDVAFNFTTK